MDNKEVGGIRLVGGKRAVLSGIGGGELNMPLCEERGVAFSANPRSSSCSRGEPAAVGCRENLLVGERGAASRAAAQSLTCKNGFDALDTERNRVMGALAYIPPLVVVPALAAKDSPFAQHHVSRGVPLLALEAICSVICVILYLFPFASSVWFGMACDALLTTFLVLSTAGVTDALLDWTHFFTRNKP